MPTTGAQERNHKKKQFSIFGKILLVTNYFCLLLTKGLNAYFANLYGPVNLGIWVI